jgi:hypothetical protein
MLCFINHQEFIQIAYYQVLLDIMGEVRFNIYFDAKGKKPLRLDPFFNQTPLKDFFLFETVSDIGTLGNRPVQLGSHVRLQNLPIYSVKHGIGAETQEIDAVCVALKPVQKFCTFGSSPKGQTEEQILEMLAVAHNLPPLNMAERLPAPLLEALNIKKDQLTHPDNISDVEAQPMRQKAVDYVVTKEDLINIHSTHPHLAGFSATIGRANLPALMALLKK